MNIAVAYRDLGPAGVEALRDHVLAQPEESWREFDHRQRAYDVHHDTETIALLFCDDAWPDFTVSRTPGYARLADVALPLMDETIARAYRPGGTILRAMAAKLKAGGRIATHIDALPSFRAAHRIHAPLTTGPMVRFTIDGRPCPMQVGRLYEINNQLPHSVINAGAEDRISFIFDYLPPS
jgi:hypothetical protein